MALRGNIALFVVVLSVAAVVAASATPSPASPGFLTGPSSEKPLAIVVGYLGQDLAEYGLQPGDVNLAIANAGVMPDGRLFAFDTRFVGGLNAKVNTTQPAIGREAAAGAAAQALGLARAATFRVVRKFDGAAQAAELSSGGISLSTIPVRLVYEPTVGGVRLAWDVGIQELDARHWWDARVDAATGSRRAVGGSDRSSARIDVP